MIKHNIEYENEIKRLISEYPVHFTRMLESKGKHKNRAKDRTYLLNYINTCTPKLNSPFYTTLTKLYWIFNDIEDFPKCANPNCQNKMVNFNVKNLKDGAILWHGKAFWIKGYTLPEKYLEYSCYKIGRNPYDYELLLGKREK